MNQGMTPASRIAVIGAGLAGLSCAQALQAAGHDVIVFEKSRGAAGRMSTKRGDSEDGTPWQCDTGAQYFTARSPEFQAEVQRWLAAGVAAEWQPRIQVFGEPPTGVTAPGHRADRRYVGMPRMTAPARYLAESLQVRTQTTVQALRSNGSLWQLRSAEHDWLNDGFDAVVLAVPAPQAIPLLKPVNPALCQLAASVRMRGSWALMARYPSALNLGFQAAFVNAGPLRWIAENSHKPGRNGQPCWLLHADADWSDEHIEDTADAVADTLLKAFAELGAPAPLAWTAHRWRYADTVQPLQQGAAWSAADNLGLCGDWLNGGKVEGAWLSGRLLAKQIALAEADADLYRDQPVKSSTESHAPCQHSPTA